MKYAWIERHKSQWPITLQCNVLNVSFERQRRQDSGQPTPFDKRLSDEALLVYIRPLMLAAKASMAGREFGKNCMQMVCLLAKNGFGCS